MNEREEIKALIDGELSPERAEHVRAAIESDPELKKEYEAMKSISQSLASLVRQPQVKGADKALQAAKGRRRFRWIEGLVAATALVAMASILFPVFAQSKESAKRDVAYSKFEDGSTADEATLPASEDFRNEIPMGAGRGADSKARAGGLASPLGGASSAEKEKSSWQAGGGGAGGVAQRRQPTTGVGSNLPLLDEDKFMRSNVRQVVKDASLSIKVEDVNKAMDAATTAVSASGGYIENSSTDLTQKDAVGSMTMRVPQENFEPTLGKLRGLGEVYSQQSSGQDVTAQVADVEARVKTLKSEEESYRTMLAAARTTSEILTIKDRLSSVRMEIESMEAQARTLRSLSALSTISVRFTREKDSPQSVGPVLDDERWFANTTDSALGILGGFGKFFAQLATYVFVLVPVWLPVALFLLWLRKRGFAAPLTPPGERG